MTRTISATAAMTMTLMDMPWPFFIAYSTPKHLFKCYGVGVKMLVVLFVLLKNVPITPEPPVLSWVTRNAATITRTMIIRTHWMSFEGSSMV